MLTTAEKIQKIEEGLKSGGTVITLGKKYKLSPTYFYKMRRKSPSVRKYSKRKFALPNAVEVSAHTSDVQTANTKSPLEAENEYLWGVVRKLFRKGKIHIVATQEG